MRDAIGRTRAIAERQGRPDLVERLDAVGRRLREGAVTVAVVGEFKRGKSTLVNAVIQRPVCPADVDVVTAVPTLVRYGEQVAVTAYQTQEGQDEPLPRSVSPDQIARVVGEGSGDRSVLTHSVEVRVPHRILRTGLRLLDTPGVGGLQSAHGQLTLGALSGADGQLLVTDASQELTAPEMEFLGTALERCPRAALVVTKIDLHQHWRRIVDLDREHLARAGLEVPVLPVSSQLRLLARGRPDLTEESGFAALVEFLATEIVRPATARAATEAAHDVDLLAGQLAQRTDVERAVLARPDEEPQVVRRLEAAHGRAHALAATSAGWQQLLSDGIQDLVADVEHDLQARLRTVVAQARDLIDQSDPRDTWTDTGAWLGRQVATAGVANRDLLVRRATELTSSVATAFDAAADETVGVPLELVARSSERRELPPVSALGMPGGRLASLIVTARTSALVPMLAVSLVPVGLPVFLLAGGAFLATTAIGAKLFRDEGRRHRDYRRQQAKVAVSKFVEEAAFEMNKETRDALRRTQRLLRDEFQARARMAQASAAGALEAATRVRALAPEDRRRRTREVEVETGRLGEVRSDLRGVSPVGVTVG